MDGQGVHTGAVLDGRYELRRVLGQGAEGTVYEAVHRFTGQRHAVKIAAAQIADRDEWKRIRLLREARALGQIRHRNIVAITDAGVSEGFPFVAMELLEGRSIEGLLVTRGRFAVPDAVGIALQVCEALSAAPRSRRPPPRREAWQHVIAVREEINERVRSCSTSVRRSRPTRARRS